MEGTIAEIRMFSGNFAPRNWAFCAGQLLSIAQNSALFSLLGTTYGGDGRTTFGLPDLRGRAPLSPGTGPGLSTYRLGQRSGIENDTLTITQIPSHTHTVTPHYGVASQESPLNAYPGDIGQPIFGTTKDGNMAHAMVSNTGGNLSHTNVQPYLSSYFIICMFGIYPSRN